jgi:hypothetical protein
MEQGRLRSGRTTNPVVLFAILFLTFFVSGCISLRDPETSFDYTGDLVATVQKDSPVEQTIRMRRSGLNGLQLWLRKGSSEANDADILTVSIYRSIGDSQSLVTIPIKFGQLKDNFPYEIKFAPINDPPNQQYRLLLDTQGGPVAVYGRNEDAYPDGSLFINGVEQAADLGFRTSYAYGFRAILEDILTAIRGIWLIFPLFILLLLPGNLVLETIRFQSQKLDLGREFRTDPINRPHKFQLLQQWDWGISTSFAIGLSLSFPPLLLLWATTLGLRVSAAAVWVIAVLMLAAWVILRLLHRRRGHLRNNFDTVDWALLCIFLLTLAGRLIMVRDLAVPAWVDPVHHATIIRLIVERGGYPSSYLPYVQASSASYHAGYHALAAFFHWLTSLDIDRAMLLLGQVMNACAVLAVYTLGTSITRDRRIGLFAAFISAFLTPMPNYYTGWGRYTQLTGLLILPVCAALLIALLDKSVFESTPLITTPPSLDPADQTASSSIKKTEIKTCLLFAVLAGFTGAGLLMVHYRVAAFLGLLMVAYFMGEIFRSLNKQPLWKTLPRTGFWISTTILIGILLTLPWWPDLWQSLLHPRMARTVAPPEAIKLDWGYLKPGFGELSLKLSFLGLGISLLRRRWFGPVIALWVGLLFISANQGVIRIPGSGNINLSSVEIMLFMPIAILGGYAVETAVNLTSRFFPQRIKPAFYPLLACSLLVLALIGLQRQIPTIIPTTILFREPDRSAIQWIDAHIPQNETILINPFLWGYGNYAGYDGGYWITPLIGRKTFPPNLLYALVYNDDTERVNKISKQVVELASDPDQLRSLLMKEGIRYIYLGRRSGILSPLKTNQLWVAQNRSAA